MKSSPPVDNFINFYKDFQIEDSEVFNKVYDENIVFQDPFHKIKGRCELFAYFRKMMKQVSSCHFEIFDIAYSPEKKRDGLSAIIIWDMRFKHNKLKGCKEININGATHIIYKDKVTFHTDYFDSSQLIYKNIPILGSIIRLIEKGST